MFNSTVRSATWVEDERIYRIEIDQEGRTTKDWCHVLFNATGTLNTWKWPEIEGLFDFRGTLLHSACWDQKFDYTDKTVAVKGTGSSAIRIVPKIQAAAKQLIMFMRSVTWIAPPVAVDMLQQTDADAGDGDNTAPAQHYYTE